MLVNFKNLNMAGPDPRLHFFDKEKAEAAYELLVTKLSDNTTYLEVDALQLGGL